MSLPGVSLVTVEYGFVDLTAAPTIGRVRFYPAATVTVAGDVIVDGRRPIVGLIDPDTGLGSVELPATDDADLNPTLGHYRVVEPSGATYSIVIPAATVGTLQLVDLRPAGLAPAPLVDASVRIRQAIDYDDTTPPDTGQAIVWNGTQYEPGTVAGGGDGTVAAMTPEPLEVLSGSRRFDEGTSFNLVTAAGTPVGAVLLLIQAEDWATAAAMPAPAGTDAADWALLDSADRGTDATHVKVWTRIVETAGAQTVTIGQNTLDPGDFFASLYVLPVGSGIDDVDVVTGSAASSLVAPSRSASGPARLLITAWINEFINGAHTLGAPPAGMVERTRDTEAGTDTATLLTATEVLENSGPTGTRAVTLSGTATPYLAVAVAVGYLSVAAETGGSGGALEHPQTIALLGDSITKQNSDIVTSPGQPWHNAMGYWTWANALLGQRFSLVGPDGVGLGAYGASGQTTAQLISNGHLAACVASGAKWAVVHAGTNDAGTPVAAATVIANLLTMWRALTAAGMRVVATTILPRGDDTVGQPAGVRAINRLIRAAARAEPGVILCDWFNYVADPTTGGTVAAYFYDSTTHPNPAGASRMGRALAETLAACTVPDEAWSPMGIADAASLLPNPYMVGDTSGGATSTAFTNQGSGTHSKIKVARTDGLPGQWQQVVVTAPAPLADGLRIAQQTVTMGTDFVQGDVVYGVCEFETDAAGWDVRGIRFEVYCNGSNVSVATVRSSSAEVLATSVSLLRPERGVLRTPQLTIPALTTTIDLAFRVTGPCTVRLGRFDVVKVV